MSTAPGMTRRVIMGISANAFGQVMTTLFQLLGVPVFLHHWGVQLYGEWLLLSAIPIYFSLSDTGFISVSANEMTMSMSRNDRERAQIVYQTTWFYLLGLSLIIGSITVIGALALPIPHLLNLQVLNGFQAGFVFALLVGNVLLSLQCALYAAAYRAEHAYARGVFWLNGIRVAEQVVLLISVAAGQGILSTAFLFFVVKLFSTFVMRWMLTYRHPWTRFNPARADFSVLKNFLVTAISYMAIPAGNVMLLQGMVVAVGAMLGPAAVVVFSTVRSIARIGFQAINSFINAMSPELTVAFGNQDLATLRLLHRRVCQLAVWTSGMVLTGLALVGIPLIHIWTAGHVHPNIHFYMLMLVSVLTNTLWYASFTLQGSTNTHTRIAPVFLMFSVLTVLAGAGIMRHIGLVGIPVALIIADLILIVLIVGHSLKLCADHFSGFAAAIICPPLWLIHFRKGMRS